MLHIHGLQHGDDIPTDLLASTWGARVELKPVAALEVTRTARYLIKETWAGEDRQQNFLALNGGVALHWSRGYLPATRRDAERAIRAERAAGEETPVTWHSEPG